MPMTTIEQRELEKMFRSVGRPSFYDASKRAIPTDKFEKAAIKLLASYRKRRAAYETKLYSNFNKKKSLAHDAIFFGGDTKKALAAIKALKDATG